jgi:hypothetical protein
VVGRLVFFIFLALVTLQADVVEDKIKNLLNEQTYSKNRAFINAIVTPKNSFIQADGSANSIKIIQVLKENGLFKLFFSSPKEIDLSFETSSNPNFFIKVMSDALANMGYYKYITKESSFDGEHFLWSISLVSEYISDPVVLNDELLKSNSTIADVIRLSDTSWRYVIDMQSAMLDVLDLAALNEYRLRASVQPQWFRVKGLSRVSINSSTQNSWYPYVAYYDDSLNLIRVEKESNKSNSLVLEIEPNVAYIKISDAYSLKNIKDGLLLRMVR